MFINWFLHIFCVELHGIASQRSAGTRSNASNVQVSSGHRIDSGPCERSAHPTARVDAGGHTMLERNADVVQLSVLDHWDLKIVTKHGFQMIGTDNSSFCGSVLLWSALVRVNNQLQQPTILNYAELIVLTCSYNEWFSNQWWLDQ